MSRDREAIRFVVDEVERCLETADLSSRRVLVAASGGIDSTVLAHACMEGADSWGVEVALGHVHHGLRGADADEDEAAVERLAGEFGGRFFRAYEDPHTLRQGGSSRNRPTLQEAARRLRYEALDRMAHAFDADVVATAHTLDDQAETVLLRLLRGCGPDGLAGMAPRSADGRVVRPLLRVSRQQIERYAAKARLSWREDVSNADCRYARNRLRNQWIPGLAANFNPRLSSALAGLAEAQQKDREWIEAAVASEVARRFRREEEGLWVDCLGWDRMPEALTRRLARRVLSEFGQGREASRAHLARLNAFAAAERPDRELELPGGLRVAWRAPGQLLCRVIGNRPC